MTYQLYDYIGGKIWLDVDESQQMALRARSEYEPNKVRAMQDFLKPGMTFVDVGACHGYFTLLAAKLVGPTGRVLSLEPEKVNYGWLRRNIATNGYENIKAYELAVSRSYYDGRLAIARKSGQHSLSRDSEDDIYLPVRVVCFDGEFTGPFDAIKIDVEGHELKVLAGMATTIKNSSNKMLLMVDLHPEDEEPSEYCSKAWDFLKSYGFGKQVITSDTPLHGLEYIGIREAQS